MSASDLEIPLDECLYKILSPLGFDSPKPRYWVRTTKEPIREVIWFAPARHWAYLGNWGFSIAFCPTLSGKGKLAWKRSFKGTKADLRVDPMDSPHLDTREFFIRYDGFDKHPVAEGWVEATPEIDRISAVAERTKREAFSLFERVGSFADLAGLFDEIPSRKSPRFGPDNYVPHDLAWSLSLMASGSESAGLARLDRWCDRFNVSRTDRILEAAVSTALQYVH